MLQVLCLACRLAHGQHGATWAKTLGGANQGQAPRGCSFNGHGNEMRYEPVAASSIWTLHMASSSLTLVAAAFRPIQATSNNAPWFAALAICCFIGSAVSAMLRNRTTRRPGLSSHCPVTATNNAHHMVTRPWFAKRTAAGFAPSLAVIGHVVENNLRQ
jgi:hypothetical protein